MAIELVDLPIKHGDFPVRYVNSPGGNKSPTSGGLSHLHPGELTSPVAIHGAIVQAIIPIGKPLN